MCYNHSSIEKHKGKVSINWLIKHYICFNLSSSLTLKNPQWSCHFMDPAFCSMHSHSMVKLVFFLFIWRKFDFLKRLGVATYFLFYFSREKQNKKEKPLVWPLPDPFGWHDSLSLFLKSSVEWNGKVVFEFWKKSVPDEERFCLESPLTSYFYFLKGKN